jgi:hypothetical protein
LFCSSEYRFRPQKKHSSLLGQFQLKLNLLNQPNNMAPRLFSLMGISLVICTVMLLEATQLHSAAAVRFNGSGNPNSRQISNAERTSDAPLVHSTSDVEPALQYAVITDWQQGESVFQTTDYTENFGVASSRSSNVNTQGIGELESSSVIDHGHHHVVFNPQRANKGSPVSGPPQGNPGGH